MIEQVSFGGRRALGFGLGAVERSNPLPPGRYWVDVFQTDSPAFLAWRARNAQSVGIEVTQHFDSEPWRDFVIFKVTSPVPWEGPGFPTIAEPWVKSSSDTAQRPPPVKDGLDVATDGVTSFLDALSSPSVKAAGTVFFIVAGGALIIYLIGNATGPRARAAAS